MLPRWRIAVSTASIALLVTAAVESLRTRTPLLLPLAAVVTSATLGGAGAGALAAVLGLAGTVVIGRLAGQPALDAFRLFGFVFLSALVVVSAEVMRRSRGESERLRAASVSAERRFAFLAEASSVLGVTLDYEVTLRNVAALVVPFLADWCSVDVIDDDGAVRRIAVAYGDPTKAELVRATESYPPDPRGVHPRTRVLRTGRSELIAEISDEGLAATANDPEQLRVMREIGYRSAMVVPLSARGQTLGALTLATAESGRRYTAGDLALAEDLARRAALAIDNARLYRSAERARGEAEAANRAKDEFLGVVSHELRTPLTAVLLWTRALQIGVDGQARAQAVATIERNTLRQARLVEDLLDVSRIVSGTLQLERRDVDLTAALAAVLATIRPAAEAKGVRLASTVDPALRQVPGDVARLRQVLANLLTNAVEYTPSGGSIDVRLEQDDGIARIRVHDTGEGIPADFLPHVFERFRQGDSTTTRSHGGLGLGLTIVRALVAMHGGSVGAESPGPGRGATFTVELPAPPVAA